MFQVTFTPVAEADLARLDRDVAQRVLKKLRRLAENFETARPEPLTGPWKGVFKLRVGTIAFFTLVTESDAPLSFASFGIAAKFTSKVPNNRSCRLKVSTDKSPLDLVARKPDSPTIASA